jgi:hypothetical protein
MNMSLLNWFSGKDARTAGPRYSDRGGLADNRGRMLVAGEKPPAPAMKPHPEQADRGESRKAKRHARRELLYVAVREAMTRSGVLSSSYKFKVLSLDQRGNQFLVMMDVMPTLGRQPEKLAEVESMIVQTAKARFEILVTSVYWRMSQAVGTTVAGPSSSKDSISAQTQAAASSGRGDPAALKLPSGPRYEPLQEDEVAAFTMALAAATASSQAAAEAAAGKGRNGPQSYTLLTGFEDTERPGTASSPALSTTQYGDLE